MSGKLERFRCHPYRSSHLKDYFQRMSKPNDHVVFDDNVARMLRAQGYVWEETPRSIYNPDKLYESLSRYSPGTVPDPYLDGDLKSGLSLAFACFARPKEEEALRMLDFTAKTIDLVTSNPGGSPGLTNYGATKAQSMTRALERGRETLKGVKASEPCLAFARTQFGGKTRLVWGYPYSETAIEGMIAYPLLQRFKGSNTPMAFAISTMALGTKLRVASYHKSHAYSIDMSAFDSSVSKFLIHRAFDILRTWFDLDQECEATGLSVREVFRHVERYFIRSPIVMPDGNIYHGRQHGVPSGSYFTQIVDSIVNVIIAGTISKRYKMHVAKEDLFVLGDDLIMWSDAVVDLKEIAKYASEKFHVEFNPQKSERFHRKEPISFLGRVWTDGIPDLDLEGIVARLVFPERFRKYSPDPEKRLREVKLMLLSHISNYRQAWRIADDVLGTGKWYSPPSAIELDVYGGAQTEQHVEEEFTSGLQRFIAKYVRESSSHMPHMATSFWM